MLDVLLEHLPSLSVMRMLRSVLVDARRRRVARTRSRSATTVGIANARVGELRFAGVAVDDRDGRAVIHAELAFEPDLRVRLAGELEHERMHLELDRRDVAAP